MAQKVQPGFEDLQDRQVPDWYDGGKFGIFIHWGIYSIPAYAEKGQHFPDLLKNDFENLIKHNPYVEWYWQNMRVEGSSAAAFHKENYGDAPYEDFRAPWEKNLEGFDAKEWAKLFKQSGAKYVVLVTKHHDGYTLWPSDVENPHKPGWSSERDIVGELADAVRAEGLKFGIYYSGGLDWTWETTSIESAVDTLATTIADPAYNRYVDAHYRELIERYKPSVLWNDISYPLMDGMADLFKDYYKAVPDGVVNDRWQAAKPINKYFRYQPLKWLATQFGKLAMKKFDGPLVGAEPAHSDFRTPEFSFFEEPQEKKWETTRGLGWGFGYNRTETEEDFLSSDELITDLARVVARNGNYLLNIGPDGHAQIPADQASRILAVGDWLRANDEAVYESKPFGPGTVIAKDGAELNLTKGKNGAVYALVSDLPASGEVTVQIDGLDGQLALRRLDGGEIEGSYENGTLRMTFTGEAPAMPCAGVQLTAAAS